jgi:DNA-binding response OmpR family regulator
VTEPLRVLVIDDDPMQLELVERALSRDGFELRAVSSLEELTRAADGFDPAIVLVDVNLPDSEPERAVRLAREVAGGARVILYSAWEDSKLRKLVLQTGADAFISKSESVVAIGRRLRELKGGA